MKHLHDERKRQYQDSFQRRWRLNGRHQHSRDKGSRRKDGFPCGCRGNGFYEENGFFHPESMLLEQLTDRALAALKERGEIVNYLWACKEGQLDCGYKTDVIVSLRSGRAILVQVKVAMRKRDRESLARINRHFIRKNRHVPFVLVYPAGDLPALGDAVGFEKFFVRLSRLVFLNDSDLPDLNTSNRKEFERLLLDYSLFLADIALLEPAGALTQ